MSPELIQILTYLFLGLAFIHFFQKNDEFILLLVFFFMATGISRYTTVKEGTSEWAFVVYAQNIFEMNDEIAMLALNYFFLGTTVFVIAYLIIASSLRRKTPTFDNNLFFIEFINKNQLTIIVLFIFFTFINGFFNRVISGEKSVAYGMSYFYLFKLAIGGLILLIFLLYKFSYQTGYKVIFLILLPFAAISSYNPNLRFQFISWMAALGLMIVKDMPPLRKSFIYFVGGFVVMIAFAMAGNERFHFIRNADFKTKLEYAFYRMSINEDQNMLDGFMMVLQVYPKHLDYGLGSEHLEILARPIPRQLWPDKPVGGYANKLGLNSVMEGQTVGISQSIYGTFYGEGGVAGIVIFSILYGYIFVQLFNYANRYSSEMRYLIKGLLFASAIPLLRGGDLPGIMAFIGMSYWPVFLFIYRYNQFVRSKVGEKEGSLITEFPLEKPVVS